MDAGEILRNIARVPGWSAVTDPREAALLSKELRRELPRGHSLENIAATPIARRVDQDDVLFALANSSKPLAVVHLTYLAAADNKPDFPWTTLYASWDEWAGDADEG